MRLSVRWSVMPNSGSMTWRVSSVIGSRPIGSSAGTRSGRIVSRYQRPPSEHAELAGRRRARPAPSDGSTGEALAERGEQLVGVAAVQVLEHAVVVEDGHLVRRERGPRGSSAPTRPVAARLGDARGGGRAVVAVGDVERGQRVDGAR